VDSAPRSGRVPRASHGRRPATAATGGSWPREGERQLLAEMRFRGVHRLADLPLGCDRLARPGVKQPISKTKAPPPFLASRPAQRWTLAKQRHPSRRPTLLRPRLALSQSIPGQAAPSARGAERGPIALTGVGCASRTRPAAPRASIPCVDVSVAVLAGADVDDPCWAPMLRPQTSQTSRRAAIAHAAIGRSCLPTSSEPPLRVRIRLAQALRYYGRRFVTNNGVCELERFLHYWRRALESHALVLSRDDAPRRPPPALASQPRRRAPHLEDHLLPTVRDAPGQEAQPDPRYLLLRVREAARGSSSLSACGIAQEVFHGPSKSAGDLDDGAE